LLITIVNIRFTTTILFILFFKISELYLKYRMSDKRLLKRYGTGKGYLIETQSGSVGPSGPHIRRAGV
jgi:hypothetical protein